MVVKSRFAAKCQEARTPTQLDNDALIGVSRTGIHGGIWCDSTDTFPSISERKVKMKSFTLSVGAALLLTTELVLGGVIASPQSASAQVALTAGTQFVYDDNVFLESGNSQGPVTVTDPATGQSSQVELPNQIDGSKNSDLITNVFVGAAGTVPLTKYGTTAAQAQVGTLIFAEQDSANRVTLDSLLRYDANELLIDRPYYLSVASHILSTSQNIGVAQGSAARQSQVHSAQLNFGIDQYKLGRATDGSLGYTFNRTDFLGEFKFNNENSSDEATANAVGADLEQRGADFISNSVHGSVGYDLTQFQRLALVSTLNQSLFTQADSIGGVDQNRNGLDRLDWNTGLQYSHVINSQLSAGANIGFNSSYLDTQAPRQVSIILPDGTVGTVSRTPDDNLTNLAYGAFVAWVPGERSMLNLSVNQLAGTDLSGQRIVTRFATLTGNRMITDSLVANATGRYLQFNGGDSLSNSLERYEVSLALNYTLMENLALTGGWNYYNQASSDANSSTFIAQSNEFDGQRVFIGLTAGFLGT